MSNKYGIKWAGGATYFETVNGESVCLGFCQSQDQLDAKVQAAAERIDRERAARKARAAA